MRITTTRPTIALSPFASSRTKGGAGYALSTVAKVHDARSPNIVIPAQAGIQCLSINVCNRARHLHVKPDTWFTPWVRNVANAPSISAATTRSFK